MPIDKIVIKDNGVVAKEIDFKNLVIEDLTPGGHELSVEGYYKDEFITSTSTNILISGEFDPDYKAVIDFAVSNGIPTPNNAQQALDNQVIVLLKAEGLWNKFDTFFKFSGTASSAFKLICWKRLIKAQDYGSLNWSDIGVQGNGFNGYINSYFNPTTDGVNFTLNDASLITQFPNELSGSTSVPFGANDSSGIVQLYINGSISLWNRLNQSDTSGMSQDDYFETGLYSMSRPNADRIEFYSGNNKGGGLDRTSEGMPNSQIHILRYNGSSSNYTTETLGYFIMGSSITQEEHLNLNSIL